MCQLLVLTGCSENGTSLEPAFRIRDQDRHFENSDLCANAHNGNDEFLTDFFKALLHVINRETESSGPRQSRA